MTVLTVKGFTNKINFGSRVNDPRSAAIIATLVRRPKYIDGIKLDIHNIEKPAIIVVAV